jgi:pyruvate/2-oxoglutarate/acetoin dehydrogenase E1 component
VRSKYHEAIRLQMEEFAKDPKVVIIGQQCNSEDFYNSLTNISKEKRIEMPVAEEMQMGLSIGLALEGYLPISIYQRMDFLPRAMDQLVNHLNLIPQLSRGLFNPKIIIRTTVGTKKPLDAGLQHSQDLKELMKKAVNFPVFTVKTATEVNDAYCLARRIESSVMIIEYQELYND